MAERMEKLVPWYHKVKDRCSIDTIAGTLCKNSATYLARSGMNGSTEEKPACKPHADILRLNGWSVRTIRQRRIRI
jgi:hypothetical protein